MATSAEEYFEQQNPFYVVNEIVIQKLGHVPILKGDFHRLPYKVQCFVAEIVKLCHPRGIYISDGSEKEADEIISRLVERGVLTPLNAYSNNFLCRTAPEDANCVVEKSWISCDDQYEVECHVPNEAIPIIGHWIAKKNFDETIKNQFHGCMAGRNISIIPYRLGPDTSPMSKFGITDSNYVVLCMRIMTRVHPEIWEMIGDGDFFKCVHSVGLPRPVKKRLFNHWPCNPEKAFLGYCPQNLNAWSYGLGFGGNSFLGKKFFSLRMGTNIAREEGWLAEHMLIISITEPNGKEHFITAAFPSKCGKTALAMMQPAIPGWRIQVIGDDVAWLKFGKDGRLYAINPEAGFFGYCIGTNIQNSPIEMSTFRGNSIFTNVAETSDGRFYWDGLESEIRNQNIKITDWLRNPWKLGDSTQAAHPNSRFMAPALQCPILHPKWNDPNGVPIEAILFGSKRSTGIPLVYETFSWRHGVLTGACLKTEENTSEDIKTTHDPMAMRDYLGYNFGRYLQHWLDMENNERQMPKIFHINWYRKDEENNLLWPGFGENIRVLDWIVGRLNGIKNTGQMTPIGIIPIKNAINLNGLSIIDWDALMCVSKEFWSKEVDEIRQFFNEQIGTDMPKDISDEFEQLDKRIRLS